MIRKLLSLILIFIISYNLNAQDFLGLSTGNYAGVSGVMLQPASIVDSRYKFDINLFSIGVTYDNNYLLVNRNAILKFNSKNFSDYQTFKSKYLSEASLAANDRVYLNVRNRIQLPLSFMATVGKKSAIALNIQSRSMIQGRDITPDFAKLAYNAFYYAPLNNRSIDASGISLNTLNWAEVGLTYGRVLYESDKHFLKAAFTGKYLAGVASAYLASNDFRFSVNNDSSINFNTTNFTYQHNKNADFDVFDRKYSPDANAFGWDAGIVYEFRRKITKFKYIRNDDEKSYLENRRDVNKYIFRVGVSLLDVGMFKFDKPNNVSSFSGNVTNWNLANANFNTIKEFDTALASRVTALPNDPRNYNIHLPSALSVQFDLRFVRGFYLNAMLYQPVSLGSSTGERFNKYGFYAFTPRWEGRHFGIYIPYTIPQRNDFTDYKQNMLGATVRLGPLFFGSSNLGNMLFNKNLRGANVHLGLKLGITYGKPNKGSQLVDRLLSKKNTIDEDSVYTSKHSRRYDRKIDSSYTINRYITDSNRLLVDYSKGQIFESSTDKRNIIIINNNYYGNVPFTNKADTNILQTLMVRRNDSMYSNQNKLMLQRNRAVSDSARKVADTLDMRRRQLDSLIRSMQQLRIQMDSTNARLNDSTNASLNLNSNDQRDSAVAAKKQVPYAADRRLVMDGTNKDSVYVSDNLNAKNAERPKIDRVPDTVYVSDKRATARQTDTTYIVSDNNSNQPGQDSKKKRVNGNDTVIIRQLKAPVYNDTVIKSAQAIKIKSNDSNAVKNKSAGVEGNNNVTPADRNLAANRDTVFRNRQVAPTAQNAGDFATRRDFQKQIDSDREIQRRMQEQQQNMLNEYMRRSSDLQSEISRLQSDIAASNRASRRNNTNPIVVQPQAQYVNPVVAQPEADTVYIRDTVRIKDTLTISKTDTIRQTNNPSVLVISSPIIRDTVIRQSFDYTAIPEDVFLFGIGKSAVRPIYFKRLNYVAGILTKHTSLNANITGHTDPSGSVEINKLLSEKRARNVADYLVNKGVKQDQLKVEAVAAASPAIAGKSKSASTQNRRVVVKITE